MSDKNKSVNNKTDKPASLGTEKVKRETSNIGKSNRKKNKNK